MAGLFFDSGIDKGFEQDLQKMNAGMNKLSSNVQSKGAQMDSTFKKIGTTFAAYLGGQQLIQFGKDIVDVTADFQKMGIVLENTLGSKAASDNALELIADFAADTPFQLRDLTNSFVKLVNQGFQPTRKELVKLGDLASSTGKGFDQLSEAIIDAQTGEFERLKEFGIRSKKEGDKVTFTFKEQAKTVDFTASSIREYILSLGELEGVQGANAKIAESLSGKISNIGDAYDKMLNNIGTSNTGLIDSGLDGLKFLIENYEDVAKVVGTLIAAYGTYRVSLLLVNKYNKLIGRDAVASEKAQQLAKLQSIEIEIQKQRQLIITSAIIAKNAKSAILAINQKLQSERLALSQAIASKDLTAVRTAQQKIANLETQKAELLIRKKTATEMAQTASLKVNTLQTKANTIATKSSTKASRLFAVTNAKLGKGLKGLKAAFASNPLGLLATALVTVVPLLTSFNEEQDDTISLQKQLSNVSSQAQQNIAEQETTLQRLLATAEDENKSLAEREAALKKLREINPKYLGDLDLQSVKNGEARKAVDLYTKALLRNATIQAAQEKIVELRKKQIEAVTEKIGIEVSTWDELVNGIKNFGNASGFIKDQQKTISKEAKKTSAVYEKQIIALSKLAIAQKESGVDFNTPAGTKPVTDKDKDKGTKQEKTLNYYQLLKQALKDAQLGLENLSGKASEVNAEQVEQQQKIIENVQQQIEEQEKILGLKKEEEKEVKKEKKAQQGSLKFLQEQLAVQKENFDYATNDEKREFAQKEIKLLEAKIKLLTKVNTKEEQSSTNLLLNSGNILGDIGSSLQGVNAELSEGLQKSGALLNDVAGIASGIASGNYIQAATAGISLIGNLVSGREADEDKIAELIEVQNKQIEKQIKLLNKAKGTERLTAFADSIDLAANKQKELNEEIEKLEKYKISQLDRYDGQIDVSGFDAELRQLQEQLESINEQQIELIDDLYSAVTGTTSGAITGAILEGFANGEKGIASFASTFEDSVRNAMLQAFSAKFLESQFDEFYKQFGEAAQSGGLSEAELNALQQDFNNKIQAAEAGLVPYNKLFEKVFGTSLLGEEEVANATDEVLTSTETPLSTAGEIRQNITEETGSILAGRLGAMVLSNERLVNQGIDVLDFAVRNLQYQKAIKENTDYLPAIEENTRKISEKI